MVFTRDSRPESEMATVKQRLVEVVLRHELPDMFKFPISATPRPLKDGFEVVRKVVFAKQPNKLSEQCPKMPVVLS